jgi:hypothetical protein
MGRFADLLVEMKRPRGSPSLANLARRLSLEFIKMESNSECIGRPARPAQRRAQEIPPVQILPAVFRNLSGPTECRRYSPVLKTVPAYWKGKLKELGLTMERGAAQKLLYDHKANFGKDDENGKRLLLRQALERDNELGERVVNFYVDLSNERESLGLTLGAS